MKYKNIFETKIAAAGLSGTTGYATTKIDGSGFIVSRGSHAVVTAPVDISDTRKVPFLSPEIARFFPIT